VLLEVKQITGPQKYLLYYYIKYQQDTTLAVLFISHCNITLHVSDAFCFHHQEYKNCSNSHWCMSHVGMIYIQEGCTRSVDSAVATDLGQPYWIYIIPTYEMHKWLLLQFLYSWWWKQKASETCRVILQWLIKNTAKVGSCWFFI